MLNVTDNNSPGSHRISLPLFSSPNTKINQQIEINSIIRRNLKQIKKKTSENVLEQNKIAIKTGCDRIRGRRKTKITGLLNSHRFFKKVGLVYPGSVSVQ